jgi:hypothetical protein
MIRLTLFFFQHDGSLTGVSKREKKMRNSWNTLIGWLKGDVVMQAPF